MDEPLSNLDAKLRGNMRAEIIRIHKKLNATTIYVTHDQTEAMTMADRIVVMKNGVVQQIGSPKEIYNHPNNLFVAGFIGAPTMNFVSGIIREQYFCTENLSLLIPDKWYALIKEKGFEGKEMILGIRPENISNDPRMLEIYKEAVIFTQVNVAELLGAEYILHTDIDGQPIKAVVHSHQDIVMGQSIQLVFDMQHIHLFDPQTEISLLQL
nr:TOBE domain-containing protein [Conservatibacter flavescens]